MIGTTPLPSLSFPVKGWTLANKEAGRVDAIHPLPDGRCMIGGNFQQAVAPGSAQWQARPYFAMMRATGALGSVKAGVAGRIYDLEEQGGIFHAAGMGGYYLRSPQGGWSVAVSGETFRSVAFVDEAPVLGTENGMIRLSGGWQHPAPGSVRRLVVAGGVVYAGVNGGRSGAIVKLDAYTGTQLPWADAPSSPILDLALAPGGSILYAAMGGPGGTVLAYDPETGKRLWFYMTDGNVQAVSALADGSVVAGMHGDYVAPQRDLTLAEYGSSKRIARKKVFQLSAAGELSPWSVALESTEGVLGVWSLASNVTKLYVGGDFTKVQGQVHPRFAVFPVTP